MTLFAIENGKSGEGSPLLLRFVSAKLPFLLRFRESSGTGGLARLLPRDPRILIPGLLQLEPDGRIGSKTLFSA